MQNLQGDGTYFVNLINKKHKILKKALILIALDGTYIYFLSEIDGTYIFTVREIFSESFYCAVKLNTRMDSINLVY